LRRGQQDDDEQREHRDRGEDAADHEVRRLLEQAERETADDGAAVVAEAAERDRHEAVEVEDGLVAEVGEQHLRAGESRQRADHAGQCEAREPQPFPKLVGIGSGIFDEKFWLPVLACAITILGLEYLYRRTLVGRAFVAIAEDNFAARALGLPERNLRIASYALAGIIGGIAGFSGGQLLLAFFANGALLNFYGFVPVALGGLGNNRGAIFGGLALGLFQQAANFLVGGIFSSVAVFTLFIVVLLAAPQGLFGGATARRV